MKTIGILGGLGPETTAQFYLELIDISREHGLVERPPITIWSVPLPYELESRFISTGGGVDEYSVFLLDGARRLERAGADFIVIPCNSVHVLIDEVRQAVSIPILSIIEETSSFILEKGSRNIGLLATTATINAGLYTTPFVSRGITVLTPDEDIQKALDHTITRLAQSSYGDDDNNVLKSAISDLTGKSAETILLACTDLQLLLKASGTDFYDTENILARATINYMMKE